MIKQLLLASVVAVGGLVASAGVADAGGPHRDSHHGHGHHGHSYYGHGHHGHSYHGHGHHGHGYYSHRPIYAPVPVYRYPAYSVPYTSHYRSGYGYGYGAPVYRSYRPSIGIGVGGGYPYYGGGFGGYRGGSGFSLYIGR